MENQVRETSAAPVYTTIPLAFLAPPASEEEFDLASYWQILVRGKWLIFVVTVLVTAWSVYQAKIATPIYRAEVLLAPVGDKGGSGQVGGLAGLASIAGLSVGGGGASGTNLVIFKSRFFLENFIVNEKIVDIISKSDSELKKLDAGTDADRDKKKLWDAVETFQGMIILSTDRKDGILSIAVEWKDRHQAALWANLLVKRLNDHLRNLAIQESEKSIEFLNNEMAKTQVTQLQQALANLLESQIQKIMMSKVRPEFAFTIVDPAVAPPEGRIVRPLRKQMAAIGFGTGLGAGILSAFLFHALFRRNKKKSLEK